MDDSNFSNIEDLKNRTASAGFASIKKIQDFSQFLMRKKSLTHILEVMRASIMSLIF